MKTEDESVLNRLESSQIHAPTLEADVEYGPAKQVVSAHSSIDLKP